MFRLLHFFFSEKICCFASEIGRYACRIEFCGMYSNKQIVKISYPILLSLVAQNLIQVIDAAFLGRVGEIELGASALAGVVYIAVYTMGFGFSLGSQILIGRRNGAQQYDRIGEIVVQGLLFLIVLAVSLIVAFKLGVAGLLKTMFHSASVGEAVMQYLDWRVYGFLFSFTNTTSRRPGQKIPTHR